MADYLLLCVMLEGDKRRLTICTENAILLILFNENFASTGNRSTEHMLVVRMMELVLLRFDTEQGWSEGVFNG
jgi:hypothetical protein